MTKQLNFILQSKGGVGKSMFTYLVANLEKENKTAFIDLDAATRTSAKRLGAIVGDKKVAELTILTADQKIERDKLIDVIEALSNGKSDRYFIDMGATESSEFVYLLTRDYSAELLNEVCSELKVVIRFFCVISGRDTIAQCLAYYNDLNTALAGHFELVPLMNEGTFGTSEEIEKGATALRNANLQIKTFGNFGTGSGAEKIIHCIQHNIDPGTMSLVGKMSLNKALKEVGEIIK
jgi:hypothetical protein